MADEHASRDKDIAGLVLSWKLQDIIHNNVYKSKVREIPTTFSSLSDYLDTFQAPLIEEIRSELHSNLDHISHAAVWGILSLKKKAAENPSRDSKQSKELTYYSLDVQQLKDKNRPHDPNNKPCPPKSGDVLALTTVERPRSIGDLIRSNRPCTLALVTNSNEEAQGPRYEIEVRPSKALAASWEMGLWRKETLYIIVLANIVTGSRLWVSLNADQNLCSLLNIALFSGPSGGSCGCWSVAGADVPSRFVDYVSKFNLNDSQRDAVLSCLSGRKCAHGPAAKIIWGPPGTGKTKTVSTLLWCLLADKCRTVTCAPTNVAVLQIAKPLRELLDEKVPSSCSFGGTGDVLLFGNEDKLKMKDHGNVKDIFLKHRKEELNKCFASLTGWNHQLVQLKCLLENSITEYSRYVKEIMEKEKGKVVEKTADTFREYVRKRFVEISNSLEQYMSIFRIHMPSYMMTPLVDKAYLQLRCSLNLIDAGFCDHSIVDNVLEDVYKYKCCAKITDDEDCATHFELLSHSGSLWEERVSCIPRVLTLQEVFNIPDNPEIETFCLINATLILCTASGSFRLRTTTGMPPIELLIIDEAAQLKECETLIPMEIPGLRHTVLIGDECQLPAVVMSRISESAKFGRSLFERLVSLGYPKHLLNIQYRMHPSISIFPNTKFYNQQIRDGENVKSDNYKKKYLDGRVYGPYSFINVSSSGQEGSDLKQSKKNMAEVDMVSMLVEELFNEIKKTKEKLSVGVISPYTAQVHAIAKKFGKRYEEVGSNFIVNVKSVDGFQGGEEDVIIMSTVRSNMNGSIGFLSNLQRTNVALTRAKHCLWIIGNGTTLINSNSIWKDLVVDAKIRGCFFNSTSDGILIEDVDQLDMNTDCNSIDSSLFSEAKWKVFLTDDFKKSFVGIEEARIRFEIVEFIKMLSNGSINSTKLKEGSFSSQKLQNHLKLYNIQEQDWYWSVEISKDLNDSNYTQVLKFWDILSRKEFAKKLTLLKKLNSFIGVYTADYASKCRFRCVNEDLEVPMIWPGSDQIIIQPTDPSKSLSDDLVTHFASLNLGQTSK